MCIHKYEINKNMPNKYKELKGVSVDHKLHRNSTGMQMGSNILPGP